MRNEPIPFVRLYGSESRGGAGQEIPVSVVVLRDNDALLIARIKVVFGMDQTRGRVQRLLADDLSKSREKWVDISTGITNVGRERQPGGARQILVTDRYISGNHFEVSLDGGCLNMTNRGANETYRSADGQRGDGETGLFEGLSLPIVRPSIYEIDQGTNQTPVQRAISGILTWIRMS